MPDNSSATTQVLFPNLAAARNETVRSLRDAVAILPPICFDNNGAGMLNDRFQGNYRRTAPGHLTDISERPFPTRAAVRRAR